jgi:hypothetical protein
MPESGDVKAQSLTKGLLDVLASGVRALETEKALLAAVLVTIVLLLIAVWAPASVGVVAWPLVALLGVGSTAWLLHDVRRQGSGRSRLSERIWIFGSKVEAGRDASFGGQHIDVGGDERKEEERAERQQ